MITHRRITSRANTEIRDLLRALAEGRRGGSRPFLAEGPHLLEIAMAADRTIHRIYFTGSYAARPEGAGLLDNLGRSGVDLVEVSESVFGLLSDTRSPQGVAGLVGHHSPELDELPADPHPLYVICDGIQDPGNLGTIIRVADAAGAQAVILLPGSCDPLSPKAVRATAGSIFSLPVVEAGIDRLALFLDQRGITLFVMDGQAAMTFHAANFRGAAAIAVGNEGRGVSRELKGLPHQPVRIPLLGRAESLNAAMAASICLYEAVRQRLEK